MHANKYCESNVFVCSPYILFLFVRLSTITHFHCCEKSPSVVIVSNVLCEYGRRFNVMYCELTKHVIITTYEGGVSYFSMVLRNVKVVEIILLLLLLLIAHR